MEITIDSLDNIRQAARQFINGMGQSRVFAFYGKMGAGKTTFIKALCEELGAQEVIVARDDADRERLWKTRRSVPSWPLPIRWAFARSPR